MKKKSMKTAASAAAQMLVQAVIDQRKHRSGEWLQGFYRGRVSVAKYTCGQFPEKLMAEQIRSWVAYFKKDGGFN